MGIFFVTSISSRQLLLSPTKKYLCFFSSSPMNFQWPNVLCTNVVCIIRLYSEQIDGVINRLRYIFVAITSAVTSDYSSEKIDVPFTLSVL